MSDFRSDNATLALKYRPRRFSDLIGQVQVKAILSKLVAQDMVPTGMVFSGSRGCGKTTSGRILAAALNCEAPGERPCGQCVHCIAVQRDNSLDVLEIDAASNNGVDDIRSLKETLQYSVGGQKRVVLLDEAHSMTKQAFNALLKTLEEPPPDTVIILLTTEPGKIIETVMSRLMPFEFRRISVSDIAKRLQWIADQEGIGVQPDLVMMIAERANGGMRDAIMTLDQVTRVGITSAQEFADRMGESDFGPELLRVLMSGSMDRVFTAVDQQLIKIGDPAAIATALVATLRDVVILRGGGDIVRQGRALEVRKEIAASLEPDVALSAMKVLWDLKTKVRASEDPRVMLDLSLAMLTDMMGRKVTAQSKPTAATGKLSLAQMQKAM